MIGLFLAVRNDRGVPTGIAQGVIMALATIATVVFQVLLNVKYTRLVQFLPLCTGSPESGAASNDQSHPTNSRRFMHSIMTRIEATWNVCYSPALQEAIDLLTHREFDLDHGQVSEFQLARYGPPEIWIPKDIFGLSDEIIRRTQLDDINITNEYATLDTSGKISVSRTLIDKSD